MAVGWLKGRINVNDGWFRLQVPYRCRKNNHHIRFRPIDKGGKSIAACRRVGNSPK
jgi:hypothetical protein